ncbi:MAG: hypothetical protein E4H36_14390, partial [Spirochaetales bacterium]
MSSLISNTMTITETVYKFLSDFSSQTKNPVIDFSTLVAFVKKKVEQGSAGDQNISMFRDAAGTLLAAELENLALNGICSLAYDDVHIKTITFSEYYISLIRNAYSEYSQNNELPFPNEEIMGLSIPQELVTSVNVREDLIKWFQYDEKSKDIILRLQFPEDFKSVIITSGLFFRDLLPMVLAKIRVYLRVKRNLNYIQNKMSGLFNQKDHLSLKEMMDTVFDKPEHAAETIRKPTDFSYRFWTSLANLIIQEFKPKASKLADEINYAQAAYITGYYNAYFKSQVQQSRDEEAAIKHLDTTLKKAPYHFTITDIYNFTDKRGVLLTKKYSKNSLHTYLKEKTSSAEKQGLPELLRLKTADNREYFIHKEVYIPLTIKKVEDASFRFRKQYIDEWSVEMKQFRKPPQAKDDRTFQRDLEEKLPKDDPILASLLRFDLLFLLKEEATLKYETSQEISRYFQKDGKGLVPLPEIFRLKREELLSYAKTLLPVWQTIPFLSGLI